MFSTKIYHSEDLCTILFHANKGETPIELIHEDSFHVKYLREYLGEDGLQARFFVEEPDYISVDYLTDYSYYYSESFKDYKKKCVRLHFFTYDNSDIDSFDDEFGKAILLGNNYEQNKINEFWRRNYLGFVVIRPIPTFMIGFTILKHYNYRSDAPHFDPGRVFWGTREYDVHVFGCHVKVMSLAFLSQDSNVAACATIAVWCMLQQAAENYYINLKSPYLITQDAGLIIADGNRIFPNSGLDVFSICSAITKCNLATEIVDLEKQNKKIEVIKKYVNAYSKIKLPIILGLNVPSKGVLTGHAVAISGHHETSVSTSIISLFVKKIKKSIGLEDTKGPLFRCGCIDKLYLHDDQWGPFSRGEFASADTILTSWTKHTNETDMSMPITLIVPVFKQIRITFGDIEDHTITLNQFILDAVEGEIVGDLSWDIQLHPTSEFKEEVRTSGLFKLDRDNEKKVFLEFMKYPLPKHIWVSTLYINDFKTFHFIHDATGLRHTSNLLFALCYYPAIQQKFIKLLEKFRVNASNDQQTKLNLEILLMDSLDRFIKKFSEFKFD